jgi:hypothetical protein
MTKEIISKFMINYTGADLPGDLHAYLLLLDGIKRERQQLDQERRQINADYAKANGAWLVKLKTLEARCPHPDTSFCGDPSGGNDSYYVCTYCGKEL